MDIISLPRTAPLSDVIAAIERDGCVIVRELAPRPTMQAIERELAPYLASTPPGEGYFVGRRTKRMGRLFLKSPASRALALEPLVLGVMDAFLRPWCSSYQINLTQAIQIFPGEPAQVFHKDDELFPHGGGSRCEYMINALWAHDDFTRENGATRIVPGSHREEVTRDPEPARIAYAEMPRGSVVIYLGSALHSGGANVSTRPRTAVVMSYCLGWLRQAENQYLAYPPDIARTLPPELQRLIGYEIHKPNLGWYEGQDPAVVLAGAAPERLAARDYMPPEIEAMLKEYHDRQQQAA